MPFSCPLHGDRTCTATETGDVCADCPIVNTAMTPQERYWMQRWETLEREMIDMSRRFRTLLYEHQDNRWADLQGHMRSTDEHVSLMRRQLEGLERDVLRIMQYLELMNGKEL